CAAPVGQRQIARARADIEDGCSRRCRHQFDRPSPPVTINVQAEQMVEKIVIGSDAPKHSADAILRLVNRHIDILSADAKPRLVFYFACAFCSTGQFLTLDKPWRTVSIGCRQPLVAPASIDAILSAIKRATGK